MIARLKLKNAQVIVLISLPRFDHSPTLSRRTRGNGLTPLGGELHQRNALRFTRLLLQSRRDGYISHTCPGRRGLGLNRLARHWGTRSGLGLNRDRQLILEVHNFSLQFLIYLHALIKLMGSLLQRLGQVLEVLIQLGERRKLIGPSSKSSFRLHLRRGTTAVVCGAPIPKSYLLLCASSAAAIRRRRHYTTTRHHAIPLLALKLLFEGTNLIS